MLSSGPYKIRFQFDLSEKILKIGWCLDIDDMASLGEFGKVPFTFYGWFFILQTGFFRHFTDCSFSALKAVNVLATSTFVYMEYVWAFNFWRIAQEAIKFSKYTNLYTRVISYDFDN